MKKNNWARTGEPISSHVPAETKKWLRDKAHKENKTESLAIAEVLIESTEKAVE